MTRVTVARDAALTDVIALVEGIVTIDSDLVPDGPYIRLAQADPDAPEILLLEIAAVLRRCPDGQVALNYAPLSTIDQRYLSVCTTAPNMNGNANFSFDYSTSFNASTLPPSLVLGGFHTWVDSYPVPVLAGTTNRLRMLPAAYTAIGLAWESDSTSHYQLTSRTGTDAVDTDIIVTIAADNPTVTITFFIPPAALEYGEISSGLLERGNLFVPPSPTSGAANFPNVLTMMSTLLAALLLSQMLLV
ncbi:hypothetical protein FOA52_000237 [Chlamydomonas sp. UWO 241]|nr:hypothetical protein FOA52_000237 [Chlamydomonas sp. UWO 241]